MIRSLLLSGLLVSSALAAHVKGTLVSEHASVVPGGEVSLGLHLRMDPGWHVYWINPGEAGIPAHFVWSQKTGIAPDTLRWPVPDTIPVTPLMTYGYHGELLLPFSARVDSNPKGEVVLKGQAKWLECNDICVPGKAEVSLVLPVSGEAPRVRPETGAMFQAARQSLPVRDPAWSLRATMTDSFVYVAAKGGAKDRSDARVRFLPFDPGVVDNAAAQDWTRTPDGFRLKIRRDAFIALKPDSLRGVLIRSSGWKDGHPGLEFSVPFSPATPADTAAFESPPGKVSEADSNSLKGLFMALFFAFLGGIVLNLMPCVLPVLSLKVFDFLNKGGRSRRHTFAHGLVFSGGVILSFLALAAAMLALRGGGEALGWGFHMQSPRVVALISILMALMAFGFWGVFEPGASFASRAGGVSGGGWLGSFFTGVTATVVATPCTAPFMGAALGYTLTRPALETFSVFFSLGLGMASPYLVLAAFPRLVAMLPKPGAWMETLKQFFGFAMAGTAVWLAWVVGRLVNADAVAFLAGLWTLVALGAWILGRWALPHKAVATRWIARLVFLAMVALSAAAVFVALPQGAQARSEKASGGIAYEPFREGTLQELRASGKPWFLYFTADWCLSCQVNERVALERPEVVEAFAKSGIRVVKADWTGRDSLIANTLRDYGRQGVPFYVLSDGRTERFLPELLTPGIVLGALQGRE